MNLASWIILAIVVLAVVAVLFYLKKHPETSCNHDCGSCGNVCHLKESLEKARKEIKENKS